MVKDVYPEDGEREEEDRPSIIDSIQRRMAKRAQESEEEEDEIGIMGEGAGYGGNGWRRGVIDSFREGDVRGMIEKAAPVAQMSVIEMATEAEDEKVRFAASQHILAQAGHGAISKVENRVVYENLPEEQLAAMVISKIKKIGNVKPELMEKMRVLMPGVDVEEIKEGIDGE